MFALLAIATLLLAIAIAGTNAIVTDDFHQPRAIFLARAHGLDPVGFASQHVPFRWAKKTLLREIAARAKACVDVYVLHTQPHFYGAPVQLRIARHPLEQIPFGE